MDVVITSPRLGGVYTDNRVWAQQFVDADSANRSLIELTGTGAALAESAVTSSEAAARAAGATGKVIYAVGHGAAGGGAEAGSVDFAPQGQLRITQFVVFHDVQTTFQETSFDPGVSPFQTMEDELRALRSLRGRRRTAAQRSWCSTHVVERCDLAQRDILARPTAQGYYDRIAAIFRANRVSRVVLLTCNAANAEEFVDELSADFNVPILAYTRRVVSGPDSSSTRRRPVIRMFLDGDAEGSGTNTDACMTNLPSLSQSSDYYLARPRPRPATPARPSVAPRPPGEEED